MADVELSLIRRDESTYAAVLSVRSEHDERRAEEYPIRFDFTALAALGADPVAYGRTLAASVLQGKVGQLWHDALGDVRAGAAAGQPPEPLRVRLWIDRWSFPLHRLRWETLRDPQTDRSLVTDMRVWFTRHLSSSEKRPVRLRLRKAALRALVAVASPDNLGSLSQDLAAIDVATVLRQARQALGQFGEVVELPQASLRQIAEQLRDKDFDLLYIVCHGAILNEEPRLLLADDQGQVSVTSGDAFIDVLGRLLVVPRLLVLASCQSAGTGRVPRGGDDASLVAIGPRLAEAGVPAVIAMHGNVFQDTLDQFMARFFEVLLADGNEGQIDRAVTEARDNIADRTDAWAPVLYSRLVDSRLWSRGVFTSHDPDFAGWEGVIEQLRLRRCVPILGSGLLDHVMGSPQELARRWAESTRFPLTRHDFDDLPRVAQFVLTNSGGVVLRGQYIARLIDVLCSRWPDLSRVNPQLPDEEPEQYLLRLLTHVQPLLRQRTSAEPHHVLARLSCPLYITTNPDTLLTLALREVGKKPREEQCPWRKGAGPTPEDANMPFAPPTAQEPLVYQMFGTLADPASLVLTEDDYFSYLAGISSLNYRPRPSYVARTLIKSGLLFLGFQLDDWDFRLFHQFLISKEAFDSRDRLRTVDVAVQLNPDDSHTDPRRSRRFLERRFRDSHIHIYWGSVEDFLQELNDQW